MTMKKRLMITLITLIESVAVTLTVSAQNSVEQQYGAGGMMVGTVPEKIVSGSEGTMTNLSQTVLLPLKHTDIAVEMIPGVISADVRQLFFNDSSEYIEANYVFPLPDDATISEMIVTINEDRVVRSVVKERAEAKKTYEEAKKAGKRAALLNRNTGSMLNMKIANLAPGDSAEVHLVYFQETVYDNGVYHLTVPTVVAPQYIPKEIRDDPSSVPLSKLEAIVENLQAPRLPPGVASDHHFTFSAVFSGMKVRRITSPSHALVITDSPADPLLANITLADTLCYPDRDVVIDIAVEDPESMSASFLTSQLGDSFYTVASVVPTFEIAPAKLVRNREVVFVIDTSGSMGGDSINQAKRGIISALKYLKPQDRFSILEFNSDFRSLIEYEEANQYNLALAEQLVGELQSNGGTEFLPVIKHILARRVADNEQRMVVFLTDGQSCQEDDVLRTIMGDSSGTKFFPISIGSSPNSALLRKMAEMGRGCLTCICDIKGIANAIEILFSKLQNPVMTDIEAQLVDEWGAPVESEIYPGVFPDVFAGLPVKCNIFHKSPGNVYLKLIGNFAGEQRTLKYRLPAQSIDSPAVAQIFGQSRISDLEAQLLIADNADERKLITEAILETALDFQLVCQYTSRVAVEELIEKQPDGELRYVPVPLHTPNGMLESTATNDWLQLLIGAMLLMAATALLVTAAIMTKLGKRRLIRYQNLNV